jgi:hypothetical protein
VMALQFRDAGSGYFAADKKRNQQSRRQETAANESVKHPRFHAWTTR